MKRLSILLLSLILILAACAAAFAEEAPALTDYGYCDTPYEILSAGEDALEDGRDGKWVLAQMGEAASAAGVEDIFNYLCENVAASENAEHQNMLDAIAERETNWPIDVDAPDSFSEVYETPSVSAGMAELLANKKAHFCLEPTYWMEDEFQKVFGTSYAKFKPESPRPGFVCVVIKKGTQVDPETAFNHDAYRGSFIHNALNGVSNTTGWMYEDAPVSTGNPHLASAFWVIGNKYSFRGYYGSGQEVKGYNTELSLTAVTADGHKEIASVSVSNQLGNTIYDWSDGIAKADTPDLVDSSKFQDFVNKLVAAIRRERSTAEANRPITAGNARKGLNGILVTLAAKTQDAWEKAIYESGASEVALGDDGILTGGLCGFDPALEEMGSYPGAGYGEDWLRQVMDNARQYGLQVSVEIKDGKATSKGLEQLQKTVKAAAAAAKKAFGSADVTAAIIDSMFRAPIAGTATNFTQLLHADESFVEWAESNVTFNAEAPITVLAPIFYTQKSQKLNLDGGPHAMLLECTGAEPAALLKNAAKETLDLFAYKTEDERVDLDVHEQFGRSLARAALSAAPAAGSTSSSTSGSSSSSGKTTYYKPGGGSSTETKSSSGKTTSKSAKNQPSFTIPIDVNGYENSLAPAGWQEWLRSFNYSAVIENLESQVEELPAMAALKMPTNGKLSGGSSGTKVHMKLSSTSSATYVQLYSLKTETNAATAFVLPGKTVTLKVPKGQYVIYYCAGPYWYGEEDMFANLGVYQKSETVEIKGTDYEHTFTLESDPEGDVSIYGIDPSEMREH